MTIIIIKNGKLENKCLKCFFRLKLYNRICTVISRKCYFDCAVLLAVTNNED